MRVQVVQSICSHFSSVYILWCHSLNTCVQQKFWIRPQTNRAFLRSSGAAAALLAPSPSLKPAPGFDPGWTVLQSWEGGGLEGRTPDEEAEEEMKGAEALDVSNWQLGSTTVFMTENGKWQDKKTYLSEMFRHIRCQSFLLLLTAKQKVLTENDQSIRIEK